MYRIYIFLLFISLQENSFSQFAYATAESGSIFYAGIDNPVSAVAENTSCKDIIVKATYGSIRRDEDCRYTFKINYDSIADPGKRWTRLEIYKKSKKGLKLLSSLRFTIKKIPDPVAHILGSRNRISKDYFRKPTFDNGHPKAPDIIAEVPFFDPSLQLRYHFQVDSFRFSIFRNDSCIHNSVLNIGCFFTEKTFEIFNDLEENDKVVFDKIFAWGTDGSRRKLEPLTITVY